MSEARIWREPQGFRQSEVNTADRRASEVIAADPVSLYPGNRLCLGSWLYRCRNFKCSLLVWVCEFRISLMPRRAAHISGLASLIRMNVGSSSCLEGLPKFWVWLASLLLKSMGGACRFHSRES